MNAKWRTRVIKVTIWIAAEITLNLLGMDTMADYGEFVLGQGVVLDPPNQPAVTLCL
ncbi:MAG: hypothetical protein HC866_05560 [Leptolyngbyaceae cyanobacterium RU_5_1]|nr:hypothetical protein [Leptolyngbyaceae cyanobacterium RU_5_1]